MSLRDRARQAAREERRRSAHTGPTDAQIVGAGALSEVLDCEVEPLSCEVRWDADAGAIVAQARVDDVRFRVFLADLLAPVPRVFEVECGRGALRRWAQFVSLAELDQLLD